MRCETICNSYKKFGLIACEGCTGMGDKKPMTFTEDFQWLENLSEEVLINEAVHSSVSLRGA